MPPGGEVERQTCRAGRTGSECGAGRGDPPGPRPQRPQAGSALLHSELAPDSGGRPAPRTHPLHQPSGAQARALVRIRAGSAPKLTPRVASGSDGVPACKGGQGCPAGGHRLLAGLAKGRGTPGVKIPIVAMVTGPVSQDSPLPQGMDSPPPLGSRCWVLSGGGSWRMSSVPVTRAE